MSVLGVAVIVFLIGLLALIVVPDLKDPETEGAVADESFAGDRIV